MPFTVIITIEHYVGGFMYKLCKTEQSTKRQREIEKMFLLALQTKLYDDISVSYLCEISDIPRKAFYRYFDSKEDALRALINHTLLEFEIFSQEYFKSDLRSVQRDLEIFFSFWKKNSDLLFAIERNDLSEELTQCVCDFVWQDNMIVDKYFTGESLWMQIHIVKFALSGLIGFVLDWYKSNFEKDVLEMALAAKRMLTTPLFSVDF